MRATSYRDGRLLEGLGDDRLAAEPGRARFRPEDQPVREDDGGDRLDVVGHEIVAAVGERARLRDAEERDAGARARAEVEARVAACLAQERDDVTAEAV